MSGESVLWLGGIFSTGDRLRWGRVVATEVVVWCATPGTAGIVGSLGEEFLTSGAGDVGEKDVGSEGGTT